MATITDKTTCRLCGSTHLELALSLGNIPLGDCFVSVDELNKPQPEFPVDLMLCSDCGQVQLSNVVDPEEIYRNYVYLTSVSRGLVAHFEQYAESIYTRYKFPQGSLAVEIGSNEGVMLRSLRARGMRVLGVDPAREIAYHATQEGIETMPFYFDKTIAMQIESEKGKAHAIIANNVMANIDDLDELAEGIKLLLAPDGIFCFETSYLLDVVQKNLLDTIFSEHISYFSVKPLRQFFARHGLELIDAERTEPKGGSLRGVVQLAGAGRPVSIGVNFLIYDEYYANIAELSAYRKLGLRLSQLKADMQQIVCEANRQGKRIAAWGAADGGTTLIYYMGLGPYLRYLIDDNPAKICTFSPGWHLQVLPAATIYKPVIKPDYIILLAWRYADRIIKAHPGYAGKWVMALPKVEVIS